MVNRCWDEIKEDVMSSISRLSLLYNNREMLKELYDRNDSSVRDFIIFISGDINEERENLEKLLEEWNRYT